MRGVVGALGLLSALAGCTHTATPPPHSGGAGPAGTTASTPSDPCSGACLTEAERAAETAPARAWTLVQSCLQCPEAPPAGYALAADVAPDPEHRLSTLRSGVRAHPDAALLWQLLGRAALAEGDEDEGLEALDRARSLRPDDTLLAAEVARAEAAHGGAEARAQARIAPLIEEAAARFDAGDTDGALNALGAALKETHKAPIARAGVEHRVALVYLAKGALPKAQAHLQAGLSAAPAGDPVRAALLVTHADVLLAMGRPSDALISASAAAEITPGDPLAHANVAEARAQLRQPDEAMKALKRAVQAGLPRRLTRTQLQSLAGLRTLEGRSDYKALVAAAWGS
ncbi:MAG: hypothetical protein KC933_20925 [Myxococcales bacterium]|nr:hypothetical protein [Myxococcales bacterium]